MQIRELAERDGRAGLAIRWEVTGLGGGLFPVLDADMMLAPAGPRSTLLTLAGAYRPPLGSLGEALDRAVLHRVASASIRNFTGRVAARHHRPPRPGRDKSSGRYSFPAATCPRDAIGGALRPGPRPAWPPGRCPPSWGAIISDADSAAHARPLGGAGSAGGAPWAWVVNT